MKMFPPIQKKDTFSCIKRWKRFNNYFITHDVSRGILLLRHNLFTIRVITLVTTILFGPLLHFIYQKITQHKTINFEVLLRSRADGYWYSATVVRNRRLFGISFRQGQENRHLINNVCLSLLRNQEILSNFSCERILFISVCN